MVSIFTGLGPGFERGSGATLGGLGVLGSGAKGLSGENVSLNAVTGNLLISRQDEFLVGRGPDAAINRTYNSLGALDENGDNWRMGTDRRVFSLTGTVNTAGSTVKRVSSDGSEITYTYRSGPGSVMAYWTTDGAGAHDRLTFSASVWTWTDGDSQISETYSAYGSYWRITRQADLDGNALTFTYTGANLNRVTTANQEYVEYSFTGNNLTQVKTGYTDLYYGGAKTLTRVRYGYDTSNRLTTVTVDLSPDDNAITDGKTYVTTYGYHLTTRLIKTIDQTDGSKVEFTYDGLNRVTQISQRATAADDRRLTLITYTAGRTDVTDPRNNVTSLFTDAAGRLTKITAPPAQTGATAQSVVFEYDTDGNVKKVTDAAGGITHYQYDSAGNTTQITDATGRITTRTYNARNSILTETVTGSTGAGPTTTLTSRYVYDVENHLVYSISAQGRVTRYIYNDDGTIPQVGESHSALYPVGTTAPTEVEMYNWWMGVDTAAGGNWASTTMRTSSYDARGNMTLTTYYGQGMVLTEGYYQKHAHYDQFGQMRFRQNVGENWEYFYYDGLGRLTSTQDQANATTSIVYNNAATQTVVTTASGYVTTKTYNKAGELISETDTETNSPSFTTGGTATYSYDRNGQLRALKDATHRWTYFIYDKMGRKAADISQDGAVVEYRYDAAGRLAATARYNNRVTVSATMKDPNGEVDLASVRPAAHAMDIWEWHVYDAAGRVIQKIIGDGSTTTYAYDSAGRLITTLGYFNKLTQAQVTGFKTTPPTATIVPVLDTPAATSRDTVTRSFYDRDGLLIGMLDAAGGLTRMEYDGKGRKTAETKFAAIASSTLWATGTFDQLVASITPNTRRDVTMRYVYNSMDQLRFTIDGLGRVTETLYFDGTDTGFAFKGPRRTIEHVTPIAALSTYTVATVKAAIASQANNANNRSTRLAYDVMGRLGYSIDANGAVVGYTYDIEGRVTETRQFATLINMSTMGVSSQWKTNIDTWVVTNSANVRVTRNFYAARGDLRFTMDAEGFVTQFDYDAEARLVAQRRFATALNLATVWTISTVNSAAKGTASVTTFGYDNRSQLVDTWDANGTRRHTGYHSNGMRAWDIIAHTQTGELRHLTNYDGAGRYLNSQRIMGGVQSQIEVVTYDGLGNIATRGDANSTLTNFTYDKAGRVKTVRDALAGTTTYDYDAAGMGTKVTDARGNASYAYYDAAGQVVLTIDAEGFATRTTYNAFGEVATVTRHITKLTVTPSVDTQPTITTSTNDNITTYTYDRLGRLSRVTDALGAYEEYTYNSFGQRLTSRNKLGGITTYTYDRRGLVVSEQLPVNNHLAQAIINRFEYDARGNRTKVTEASGLAEQRVTTYQYDAGDRLTHKISEARQTIASGTANAVSLAPTEQYFYDRRGNVIEKRSPDGARQLYWYNNRNQVSHSLSALGILTQNIFDADGNVTETRVYETPVALPADATGAVPTGVGNFRVTQYVYDALNRVTEVRVPDTVTAVLNTTVVSGTSTTTLNVATRTLSTTYSYDALGNVTRTTDAELRTVHSYYDKLGRKTSEVDQEQFRTDWTYDANGNVTRETRYATRLATAPTIGAAVPAVVTAATDRITSFGYDKLGRRIWLQRANVQVHDSAANSGAGGAHRTTTSTINYAYNGLNQVVLKTEATGDTVTNTYDVGGRLTRQRKSGFVDFQGTTVNPTIDYAYDGLGNLRTTTQLGQGDAAARVSTFVYGTGGLLTSATDAAGFVRTYRHDVTGRVTREEYARVDAWGNLTYEASGTDYDLEGRVVAKGVVMNPGNLGTWTRGDGRSNDTVQMKYNAFGEVVESGINGIVFEKNDFDKAGRLWRTNSGDGVWKYYLYNGTGQRTIAITSEGTDLANNTLDGVLNLWGANRDALRTAFVDGVTATLTRYDGRGMATEVLEPQRELNLSTRVNLTSNRGYNAFGELAWEQNAGGFRIDYGYNTMGRQIKIDSPSVQVTSEAGATTPQRLAEHRFYDVSGRLVASRDANGFITRMTLLGGTGYENNQAQVLRVDNPDGSYTENRYDIHGDIRVSVGPMSAGGQQGYITRFTYDRMGRKITATHPSTLIDTTNLIEYFSYDGLGQQIRKYNSFQGLTAAELTAYDQQGRVTYLRGAAGDITQTAYQFTDVGTWGLGTFGGWIKGTTFANGKTIREWTDVYGRTTASEDMSGRMTWNYFDMAGRVVRKNSNGAGSTDLNLSWYNTGKLAVQTHGVNLGPRTAWAIVATGYGYDAVGNLTQETTVRNGVRAEWEPPEPPLAGYWIYTDFIETVSDQRATYDALGRMLTWSEIGGNAGVLSAASTAWQYDANGNIRSVTSNFAKLNSFGVSEATTTKSDWFKYDSMNRVTLDRGIMLNGQIVRGANGITIAYNGRGERLYTLRGQEITAVPVVPPPPPPNSAPVATADTASGVINTTVSVSVLANDTDADGDPLSITAVSFDAARVQVTRVQNTTTGRFDSLSIVGLQLGATTITYTINDGKGGTATGTLTFTANPIPNRAPVAVADTSSGQINTTVSVPVLSNDTDADGDPLSITAVSFDAARLQVTRVQNTTTGRFDSLSIVGLQLGATSITYTISDGRGGTTTGTLTFTVTPIPNRAPVANADASSGQIQTIVSVPVLSNDTDPDGDPLSITAVSFDASRVQVTRVQNTTTGRFDSLSIVGLQLGATNITYTISDGRGGTTTGTLTYTVNPPPNRAPVAVPDASSGQINTSVSVLVLSNDTDPDGDPLSITAVSFDASRVQVTRVQNAATGRFDSLSIVGLQLGATDITYTISDGRGGTTTGTLTYTVNPPPNRAPIANADTATGQINLAVPVFVLANDSDPDGDPLDITGLLYFDQRIVGVTRVLNNATGRYDRLEVTGRQIGAATINYTVGDGRGGLVSGVLSYTVTAAPPPPNAAPVANADSSSGQVLTTVYVPVLGNDTDPDGDALSITNVSFDSNFVQVTRSQNVSTGLFDGLFVTGSQVGNTNITYAISDGKGGQATGTLSHSVTPVPNRAPVANYDSASGQVLTTVSAYVLGNDTDPDGDPLSITDVSYDTNLVQVTRVQNASTGRFDRLDIVGLAVSTTNITYTISDGRGGQATGTLAFTTTPVPNRAPVANYDNVSGELSETILVAVLDNDSDPDGDPLSISRVTFDASFVQVERLQSVATGRYVFLEVVGLRVGTTRINYQITDGRGGVAYGDVDFTVRSPPPPPPPPPNRAPVANSETSSGQIQTTVYVPVLANDSDPDGDALTITDVSYDTNLVQVSRVQNSATGLFDGLYVTGSQVGNTNIAYTISDGKGGQTNGTLVFNVTPAPPPPPNYGNYVLNHPDVYAEFYLSNGAYGDIAAFGARHYQLHGAAEGRQLYWSSAPAAPNFAYYVLNHADLVIAFNQSGGAYGDMASFGARHYQMHGHNEGRQVYWSQPPAPPPPPPPPPPGGGGDNEVPIENPGLDSFAFAMVGRSSMLVSAMAKSAPMAPMAAMSVTTVATTSFSGETGLNGFSSGIARDDYEYDSSGRLIAVYHNVAAFGATEPTTKGGQVAAMAFDALGRMTRQTDFTGPGSTQVAVDRMMTYDLAGRVTADTTRTRQNDGQGNGLLVDNISTTTYDAIGTVLSLATQTNRYRNANAYTGRIGEGQGAVWGTNTSSTTTYTYEWYQGAVQTGITYKEGSATRITTFTMANIAGQMVTKSVLVNDGRARTVTFDTDVSGQVIRRRESDNNYSQGDPSAMWYRFAGRQMGMITNNGGWEGSYAASVAQRQAAPATTAPGAFANGATVGKQEEQFSSNLEVINSYSQGSVAGSYVVRSGDSLQGIAQNLWGDSGLWYKLAEANGLSGAASLFEGQTLRLPAGVMRNTYNASSVTPYNPAETLGDVTPSTPQSVPPKKQRCGIAGQVLLVIIAVVVTYLTKGATKEFFAGVFKAMGASATAAAAAATVASHATAAAIGSTVSQAVGVATGIQEKFSWKEVGAAFVSGGVASHTKATTSIIDAIIQGAKNSAISQAINVTLGLQDKFSWAAVAAAGVGGGVGYAVGNTQFARGLMASGHLGEAAGRAITGTAAVLASAATRSAIDGSDFGDSVRAAIPDILGGIIANFALSEGPLWTTKGEREPPTLRTKDGSHARRSEDDHREVIIVQGRKRGFFEAIMKRGADSVTGAYDDVTSGALQRGIRRWSGNNGRVNGPRADGTYSPRDAYLINAKLHASISALSALDAVTLFGKNGTTGGAAYDAFQNRSALGGLGVAIEAVPLLRSVASAQSIGGMGAKAAFSVPTKALDIIPEGPLAKLSTGSNTNVIGPLGLNGPNPFGGADFTVAGGVNFQVAVPTARVGSGVAGVTPKVLEPSGQAYSVAYEVKLSPTSYPGVSRQQHFREANESLLQALDDDVTFAQGLQNLGINLQRTPTGLAPRNSPSGWTWHHADEAGIMQLVPLSQHKPGSIFQAALHPNNAGGYSKWGK